MTARLTGTDTRAAEIVSINPATLEELGRFQVASAAEVNAAVARARMQTGQPLELTLEGEFARASVLRARVRTDVDLASIPLFGSIGTVEVSGDAAAPVDRYRSLVAEASP